jgi:3-oxoacyl-[acyl-carrier-protein] synthase-1
MYDTAIVVGVDILTPFVVSGFKAFKAVSEHIARPYDADRDGISLGEACGSIALTTNHKIIDNQQLIAVTGGASSNDANHISGPSRTGDGLLMAINKTLQEAGILPEKVDYISGHGTATVFNDEMETLAVHNAGLAHVPMNSLKSYFGHTLGAAGVVESVIGLQSMRTNTLIGTYNFNNYGVTGEVNILKQTTLQPVRNCLKTAAGFGGCNAAVFFEKINQ